ncbi:calcyclin-binding protein [Diorhabda sublineata]|uniref:calcyclin-binding protein n=1 Tax=Diorhabda sublineata TaxID=1163346 RepID=UPI0024E0549B|nr:calcyclin-binding protein [Diorhabda sublineata]
MLKVSDMDKVDELKKDIAELESFQNQATRQKNKDILSIQIRKLISDVVNLEEKLKGENSYVPSTTQSAVSAIRRYEVKINNYAWDQSEKFVKFYITLKNVQTALAENICCEFTPKNINLSIKDVDNKDYKWEIKNLLQEIDPEKSSWKIKSDTVLINAAKKVPMNWSHVTEWEKKASESKVPKMDTEKLDPTEGLMSLMKNMYETGDDEMKRTIAKAWTESQQKNQSPNFLG